MIVERMTGGLEPPRPVIDVAQLRAAQDQCDAVYVDPYDVASIRSGIEQATAPSPRRVARWDEVARATRSVYEEALAG